MQGRPSFFLINGGHVHQREGESSPQGGQPACVNCTLGRCNGEEKGTFAEKLVRPAGQTLSLPRKVRLKTLGSDCLQIGMDLSACAKPDSTLQS